ncbi:serine/threonine-protein kinase OSR1 [Ricinus communis]|uniref:serine/threonine-protein kinase OSR1 n=1 Tax=Ricinus communis TaxID=3988 RepID=UPI00201AEA42|nr:serine/threonine-protein kinase OSR1 [Ricinus communis]
MEKKKYPIGAEFYVLYEEVGQGVTASVHRALCIPFDEIVAIKILDFERDNSDLNNISREVQTMILVDHPNVLKSHCSFVSDHNLWVVMPFMSGGSCLHILKAAYPDGFEEVVIATILHEVLRGLEYLHHHGHIHRDVKAENILIDSHGAIKLGDFGVSASLFDSGDRQRMRNTFVGTPCWMAPEVMEQLHGYAFKADIWSFGITALELAHGHAPFSKYPPMKVLLMTLQNAPPGLDYERDKKFSKSFKQMIASCLVKDSSKRPSAKKLLKHSFFKQARSNDYIARKLLEGLPALGDRIKALKRKEEDMLAQKKMPDGEKEEISQNEYKREISGWNFNLKDMKAQASLIHDEDLISDNNLGGSSSSLSIIDSLEKQLEFQHSSLGQVPEMDETDLMQYQPTHLQLGNYSMNISKVGFEKSDDDFNITSPSGDQHVLHSSSPYLNDNMENNVTEKSIFEINRKPVEGIALQQKIRGPSDGSNPPENIIPFDKEESDKLQNQSQNNSSSEDDDVVSQMPFKASKILAQNNDELEEKVKPPVVQQRGRFKVTSKNVGIEKVVPLPILQKSHSMQVLHQHPGLSVPATPDSTSSTPSGHSLFPLLNSVLQNNIIQRDSILNLMKQVCGYDTPASRAIDGGSTLSIANSTKKSLLEAAHDREKELLHEITEL